MGKHWGNFKLNIENIFLSNFSEIVKKFLRKVRNILNKFFNILMEISRYFCVNFWENLWKNYPKNMKLF